MFQVGVAAYSGQPTPQLESSCRRFVERLASLCGGDTVLIVGGYWGLMKCVVDEAITRGLQVVIVPPVEREDYGYPGRAIVLRSGCSFRCRSMMLVRSSDVLVALGGAVGTLIEVLAAYAEGKPVYVLSGTGLDSDRYRSVLSPYVDSRMTVRVEYVGDAGELAEKACKHKG